MEGAGTAAAALRCSYALPPVIPWADLDADHVISAGQVFRSRGLQERVTKSGSVVIGSQHVMVFVHRLTFMIIRKSL